MKAIKIIPILLFISILFSCGFFNLPNCPDEIIYTRAKMNLRILDMGEANTCDYDNFGEELDENETCSYNSLIIDVYFDYETEDEGCFTNNVLEHDSVRSIYVVCNNDYNETYKSGDTINDIINIKVEGTSVFFCNNINQYFIEKPEVMMYERYELFLTEAPLTEHLNSFTIYFEQEGGTIFSDTTKAINILP
jgi:hypothetical protein